MTASANRLLRYLASMGLPARLVFMLTVLAAAYAVIVPCVWLLHGVPGIMAGAVALLFCLVGGLMGLVISDTFRVPGQALVPLLLSMLCRMGVPLGLCLFVYHRRGTLADAGLAYYVIGFYLLMLLVDSAMTVSIVHPRDADSNAT